MPVKCFFWPLIQEFLNMFDFLPCKLTKISLLRKKSHQHIGVYICSSLAWAMRVTKVELHLCFFGRQLMLCHLFTSIIGHRKRHLFRQSFQLLGKGFSNLYRIPSLQRNQYHSIVLPIFETKRSVC